MLYRLLIVTATLIWGSSFVVVKDATDYLDPAWILFVRFASAAVILFVVFFRYRELYFKREYILYGSLFGLALGTAYYVQTLGIVYTTPGKNAFLTGTYCVMVPFLSWVVTRIKPTWTNLLAAFLAIVGVGFVCLGTVTEINIGDALTLLCAVFYAIHIILVATFAKGRNIYVLTLWQFVAVAVLSFVVGLATGTNPARLLELSGEQWLALAYLAIMCTAVALLFQNIGQANIPPSSASLLLALESPFGVAFSVAFGAEVITGQLLFGFALIFAGILVSEVLPARLEARKQGLATDG